MSMLFYNKERLKKSGEKLVAQGQLDKAVGVFEKILAREPDETDILVLAGELQIRLKHRESGLALLKKAAILYGQGNEPSKAISIFKKYLQHDPENLEIMSQLADLHQKAGHAVEASQVLLRAAAAASSKDPSQAIYYYEKVLKHEPDNADGLALLAELYLKQKLIPKAVDCSFRAGRKFFEKGNYAKSYMHLYTVIQHEPDNQPANLMILETLVRLKSFEDALIHWNAMSKGDNETDLKLLQYRGDILLELDRKDELKGLVHKMGFMVPESYSIVFRYVDRALAGKRYQMAVELLDLLDLSQYYLFSSKITEVLTRILGEDEDNVGALQKMAELKLFTGDVQGVSSMYAKLYQNFLKAEDHHRGYQLLEKWLNLEEENDWIRQEMRRLRLILDEKSDRNLDLIRGKLEEISLADLIQMLESARKTGVLQIRYTDRVGKIYFSKGAMIHAAYLDSIGADSIYHLLKLPGGDFNFDPNLPAGVVTSIQHSNTQVVLDALRIIDEEAHQRAEGGGDTAGT
jgi:tetratricopeptide (TPR) repeat protein